MILSLFSSTTYTQLETLWIASDCDLAHAQTGPGDEARNLYTLIRAKFMLIMDACLMDFS